MWFLVAGTGAGSCSYRLDVTQPLAVVRSFLPIAAVKALGSFLLFCVDLSTTKPTLRLVSFAGWSNFWGSVWCAWMSLFGQILV